MCFINPEYETDAYCLEVSYLQIVIGEKNAVNSSHYACRAFINEICGP